MAGFRKTVSIPELAGLPKVIKDIEQALEKLGNATENAGNKTAKFNETQKKAFEFNKKTKRFYNETGKEVNRLGEVVERANKRTTMLNNAINQLGKEGKRFEFLSLKTFKAYRQQGGNLFEYVAEFLTNSREELRFFGFEVAKFKRFIFGFIPGGFAVINKIGLTLQMTGGTIRALKGDINSTLDETEKKAGITSKILKKTFGLFTKRKEYQPITKKGKKKSAEKEATQDWTSPSYVDSAIKRSAKAQKIKEKAERKAAKKEYKLKLKAQLELQKKAKAEERRTKKELLSYEHHAMLQFHADALNQGITNAQKIAEYQEKQMTALINSPISGYKNLYENMEASRNPLTGAMAKAKREGARSGLLPADMEKIRMKQQKLSVRVLARWKKLKLGTRLKEGLDNIKMIGKKVALFFLGFLAIATLAFVVMKAIGPQLKGTAEKAFKAFKVGLGIITGALGIIWESAKMIWDSVFGDGDLSTFIAGLIGMAWGILQLGIGLIVAFAGPLLTLIWHTAVNIFNTLREKLGKIVKENQTGAIFAILVGFIAWWFTAPVWLIGGLATLAFLVLRKGLGAFVSAIGDALGGILGFAGGGTASGRMNLVGEKGPELVKLPAGSRVYPTGQSKKMMGTNNVFNITINAKDTSDAEMRRIADKIGNMVSSKINRRTGYNTLR